MITITRGALYIHLKDPALICCSLLLALVKKYLFLLQNHTNIAIQHIIIITLLIGNAGLLITLFVGLSVEQQTCTIQQNTNYNTNGDLVTLYGVASAQACCSAAQGIPLILPLTLLFYIPIMVIINLFLIKNYYFEIFLFLLLLC